MKKGKLIAVEKSPGQIVKMYEADALRLGYIKPLPAQGNKMHQAEGNKVQEKETIVPGDSAWQPSAQESEEVYDDFSTIAGLGPATTRALVLNGITTFDKLMTATNLESFLHPRALAAIVAWREGRG